MRCCWEPLGTMHLVSRVEVGSKLLFGTAVLNWMGVVRFLAFSYGGVLFWQLSYGAVRLVLLL